MEKPRPSTIAWGAIIGGVAAYDYLCPPGEQLSERADEWVEHPIKNLAFTAAVGAVALHLCNRIDERFDVVHHLASFKPKHLRPQG